MKKRKIKNRKLSRVFIIGSLFILLGITLISLKIYSNYYLDKQEDKAIQEYLDYKPDTTVKVDNSTTTIKEEKETVTYNSIITHNILDILNSLEEGVLNQDQLYILRDAIDYLLKVYANILFSKVYSNKDYDIDLKHAIQKEFLLDMHYVYAKNVYQEYLHVLNRAYMEAKEYSCDYSYIRNIASLSSQYSKLLDDVLNNDVDKHMFWNFRNAIIHNQILFSDSLVRLYITGSNIRIKHYQKKKKEWVDKEFRNKRVIWEMKVSKDEFLRLMDKMYELEGIPIKINISKFVRKKESRVKV